MNKLRVLTDESPRPWYKKGLSFACTSCGKCCTGSPGYVFVTQEEIEKIAEHLSMKKEVFIKRYTKQVHRRYSLIDTKPHYDCIFLQHNKCRIYSVRPTQCRSYPFWPDILSSKQAWEAEASRCEGINSDKELLSFESIEKKRLELPATKEAK